jgi:uroporphyrinogen-III synthase
MTNTIAEKTYALFPNAGSKKILSKLEDAGAQIIKFPLLESETVSDETSNELLGNLQKFDWIIFPDVLTVDFFLQKLEKMKLIFSIWTKYAFARSAKRFRTGFVSCSFTPMSFRIQSKRKMFYQL